VEGKTEEGHKQKLAGEGDWRGNKKEKTKTEKGENI